MKALLWSVAFGAVALACAFPIVGSSAGEGWDVLPYGAGVAAFLWAGLLRWLWGGRTEAPTRRRGAAVGAIAALLSHPLAWWLSFLYQGVFGKSFALGDAPPGATDVLAGGLVFSLWSLLFTGWWTVPVGALLGVLLTRLETRIDSFRQAHRHHGATDTQTWGIDPMALTTVLFLVGGTLLMIGSFVYPPLYDLPAGFDWATVTIVFVLLLVAHGVILRKRGERMLLLVPYTFFFIPTALALAVGGKLTLNGALDGAESTHHVPSILGYHGVRSSSGPGTPFKLIHVKSWTDESPDPWISVDESLYSSADSGDLSLGVVTKPGRLGIQWILDVHREPSEGQGG